LQKPAGLLQKHLHSRTLDSIQVYVSWLKGRDRNAPSVAFVFAPGETGPELALIDRAAQLVEGARLPGCYPTRMFWGRYTHTPPCETRRTYTVCSLHGAVHSGSHHAGRTVQALTPFTVRCALRIIWRINISHPSNTGCSPLNYSGNPGVNVPHREGCVNTYPAP
jgi:hypothetical protein